MALFLEDLKTQVSKPYKEILFVFFLLLAGSEERKVRIETIAEPPTTSAKKNCTAHEFEHRM